MKFGFFISAAAVWLTFSSANAAQPCDPLNILLQDTHSRSSDFRLSLSEKESTETNTKGSQSSSGNISFMDILTGGGDEKSEFSKALRKKFALDFDTRERKWQIYTWMSDNAREAYKACLEHTDQSIFIYPSDNVMTSAIVTMRVNLRPFVVRNLDIHARFSVRGGAKVTSRRTRTMAPGDHEDVDIERDLKQPFAFRAEIGGDAVSVEFPAREQFKFKQELRYSKEVTTYGHACNDCHDNHQICVTLDNDDDAVIIPHSAKWIPVVDRRDGITFSTHEVGDYNERQVCLAGGQSIGKKNAGLTECGYVTAAVIVKIPVDANGSPKAAEPAYARDPKTCHK